MATSRCRAPRRRSVGDPRAKYLEAIVAVAGEVAVAVEAAERAGDLVVVLGGDHSLALGVFAGLARVHGPGCRDLARRARRLQHARDEPDRQRARHAARRRARLGR